MSYNCHIFHTPGKHKFLTGALSHPNDNDVCEIIKMNCSDMEFFVCSLISSSMYEDVTEEVRGAVSLDASVQRLIHFKNSRWPSDLYSLRKELLALHGAQE